MSANTSPPPPPASPRKSGNWFKKIFIIALGALALVLLLEFAGVNVLQRGDQMTVREKPGQITQSDRNHSDIDATNQSYWDDLSKWLSGDTIFSSSHQEMLQHQLELSSDEIRFYRTVAIQRYGSSLRLTDKEWRELIKELQTTYSQTEQLFENVSYLPSERITSESVREVFTNQKMRDRFVMQYSQLTGISPSEIRSLADHTKANSIGYWAYQWLEHS